MENKMLYLHLDHIKSSHNWSYTSIILFNNFIMKIMKETLIYEKVSVLNKRAFNVFLICHISSN